MKILNDPIYGFITVPHPTVLRLIDHPWFQRLRYIKQLGLGHLVYPGALHTRFHHALGAMHLMGEAIATLRGKGHDITDEEALGARIAILLHDVGHGPFSHALEHSLVEGVGHEDVSALVPVRGKVTVFDFSAPWCEPCKVLGQHLDDLAKERADLAYRKLDIGEWHSPLAKRYLTGIEEVPYVVVYGKGGERVASISGLDVQKVDDAIAAGAIERQ